jgi:hypothetical protein
MISALLALLRVQGDEVAAQPPAPSSRCSVLNTTMLHQQVGGGPSAAASVDGELVAVLEVPPACTQDVDEEQWPPLQEIKRAETNTRTNG